MLAEGIELLSRVPDLADAQIPLRPEKNVVIEADWFRPHSRRLKATLNFVVLLSRHVCGAEADNDADTTSLPSSLVSGGA